MFPAPGRVPDVFHGLDANERAIAQHRATRHAFRADPQLISDDAIINLTKTGLLSLISRESMRAMSYVDSGHDDEARTIMLKVRTATQAFLYHRNMVHTNPLYYSGTSVQLSRNVIPGVPTASPRGPPQETRPAGFPRRFLHPAHDADFW